MKPCLRNAACIITHKISARWSCATILLQWNSRAAWLEAMSATLHRSENHPLKSAGSGIGDMWSFLGGYVFQAFHYFSFESQLPHPSHPLDWLPCACLNDAQGLTISPPEVFCRASDFDTKAPLLKSNRHKTELSLSKTKKQLASIALATKVDFGQTLLPDQTDEIATGNVWEPNFLCLELDSGVHSCANTPESWQNVPKVKKKSWKEACKVSKNSKQLRSKLYFKLLPSLFDKRKDTRIPL